MADGIGCECYAHSEGECCCDVDWTPQELIDLRERVDNADSTIRIARKALAKDHKRVARITLELYVEEYDL